MLKSVSGVAARQWRRSLAAKAERCDDSIRTLKFPLDGANVEWHDALELHTIVAGDGRGSLIGLLYGLLLGGFRVFPKFAATEAFRNDSSLDDESWRAQVLDGSALTVGKDHFIPSVIYKRLLTQPRAVGGKDAGFKPETIAIEYGKTFFPGKKPEMLAEPEKRLLTSIATALASHFPSWKAVAGNVGAAAGVIDVVLHDLGYPRPQTSLQARLASIKTYEPAGTIAFDADSVPPTGATEGIAPNLIVARALAIGRKCGLSDKKELTRFAQEFFTGDGNHAGLAWLFGKGLTDYLQVTEIERVFADFDVPVASQTFLRPVLEDARRLPAAEASFLGGKNYASYRSGIGGTLASWIANYVNRLCELEETLGEQISALVLPSPLLADEKLFEDIGTSPDEIANMSALALERRESTRASLSRLNGVDTTAASGADITAIEEYNVLLDTLAGLLSSLAERIKKELEIAMDNDDGEVLARLKTYDFETPTWVGRMGKINRLDLSPIDPANALDRASQDFAHLHNAMHAHYAQIRHWAEQTGQTLSPLSRLAVREQNAARHRTKPRNADEYALRACLDMIGRSARRCSEEGLRRVAQWFNARNIFAEPSHCNQYFFNRRGILYKSPFARTPRQPFPITREAVTNSQAILDALGEYLLQWREDVFAETPMRLAHVTDLFRVERAWFAMLLTGFPETIPSSVALVDQVKDVFSLPLPVRLRLTGDMVSSAVMRQIFNQYYSQLESLAAVLLRETFFCRAKFQRSGDNALLYASVDGAWNAPDRLYGSSKPIGEVMRRLERANEGRSQLPFPETLAYLCDTTEAMNAPEMMAFLRQAPHDWRYAIGNEQAQTDEVQPFCLSFDKQSGIGARLRRMPSARLVGAPAYKGVLDQMLVAPDTVTMGDIGILVDQYFTQATRRDDTGRVHVQLQPGRSVVTLAIPMTISKPQKAEPTFSRYMGIDLGERGIGYAVFDAATHTLIDKGVVKVKSMRRFVLDDKMNKRKRGITKFRAAYDPAEERRRENVVGDFCHAINRLMWYYDAFPVLESTAGGASSGINRIYKAVAEHYLYSTTPTVDAVRKAYWTGASYWKHPFLQQFKFDRDSGKKSNAAEPLRMFPAVGVSAYGTSQECSCCGRNAVEDVRNMQKAAGNKKGLSMTIEEGGIVRLESGSIVLLVSEGEAAQQQARNRNERAPRVKPHTAGSISADDLIRLIARNLRRAPASRQSRDTTVSQYHCVYEDCAHTEHAEINAGINIGRRMRKSRLAETSPV
ncbi:type V CRISPR-associated protein Cas12c [Paraburkholderia humisilvae]|uniref:Uncharacterized protein n=1 Tax=Paraburkholderia humisilvae TaxID=627669 RepID=A0A6J5DIX5_9BURK|nr:type V CRISPR-associated protein Cas12c [Paraburkholderia humisilvae]CAB3754129.1 hypothetical protein LMG29542_02258 [Paraburkholderia humisilvae]